MKTTLWRHQQEAVEWMAPRQFGMLAMAMGSGKSLVSMSLAERWGARSVLILCPKSVVDVWPHEIQKHGDNSWHCEVLRGAAKSKALQVHQHVPAHLQCGKIVAVVNNYDSAWRAPLADALSGRRWDVVVCDESHRVKSARSRISWWLFKKMFGQAGRRVALTGTPMPNSPMDLYGQFRFLAPGVLGPSFVAFRNRYAKLGGPQKNWIVGFQNQADLQRRFADHAFRVDSSVLDLPESHHVTRTFELSPAARRIYEGLRDEMCADLDSGVLTVANALVRLLRLQQVTSGCLCDDDGTTNRVDTGKADLLADILEDLHPTEPIVIFCLFRSDLEACHAACAATGRRSLELSGSRKELAEWQAGHAPALIIQIRSGGLGIDLTRARYAIYYSLGFSLGDYEQSLARVLRPGQRRAVTYLHLVADQSVDQYLYRALERKADVVEEVLSVLRRKESVRC